MYYAKHEIDKDWTKLKAKTTSQAKREATALLGKTKNLEKIVIGYGLVYFDLLMKRQVVIEPLIENRYGFWQKYRDKTPAYISDGLTVH